MAKLQTVEIKLPFAGFYNSVYSSEIDSQEAQFCENATTESGNDDSESNYPAALQLDASELAELLFSATDYSAAYNALARDYVDAFSQLAGSALGISAPEMVSFYSYADKKTRKEKRNVESLRLTFADMSSPREYNFTTDRIFANIPVSVVRKLWAISKQDGHAELTRVALERHSSRSGFISGYRSDWQEWGPVATWDHNQLETLLIAVCEIVRFDWNDSELTLYYATCDNDSAYTAWSNAVDWSKFEAERAEKRAEKLAEWLESDPDAAKNWIGNNAALSDSLLTVDANWPDVDLSGLPYRCSKTPDLFA